MAVERIGNIGYLAIKKQTDKNLPVIPDFFLPLYDESISTNRNFVKQQPIFGNKFITYDTLPGQRDHQGELTTTSEPNGMGYFADMLLTKVSTTGAGPYTHVFRPSVTANPNAYTADISFGNIVKRFWGFEASKIAQVYNQNEKQAKITGSALGSFQGRTIATVSTNTLTLDTTYDPAPNKGLIATDLVRIFKVSDGTTLDTTVTTVNGDGITVVLGASAAAFAAGDIIHLRPATQTFNLLPTFLWAKTEYRFGATAAAALSAAQTRVEVGSSFEISHSFEDDGGAKRSGGFDPAALVRTTVDAQLTVKKFFDTPEGVQQYNDMVKTAAAIRQFSGATNQYEERLQFHRLIVDNPVGNIKSQEVTYATQNLIANYDQSDGQSITYTIINGIAVI